MIVFFAGVSVALISFQAGTGELDIKVPTFPELILLFSNSSGEYEAIIKMDWESVLN